MIRERKVWQEGMIPVTKDLMEYGKYANMSAQLADNFNNPRYKPNYERAQEDMHLAMLVSLSILGFSTLIKEEKIPKHYNLLMPHFADLSIELTESTKIFRDRNKDLKPEAAA